MAQTLTAQIIFDTLRESLELTWAAGEEGRERAFRFAPDSVDSDGLSPVGFLNLIRSNKIQVLGVAELAYLAELNAPVTSATLHRLFGNDVVAVIVADNRVAPEPLVQAAQANAIPLFVSALSGEVVIELLLRFLDGFGGRRETLHGVFMEVMGIGVLLAGSSGVGKSELALELITRGHRLIADDAPEFSRVISDMIRGSCPKPLQDFLEVRGLGILDIRAMFGDNAIKHSEALRLIVRLTRMVESDVLKMDRLQGDMRLVKVLGVDIPEITVPVLMGGHLAVVVEGAVRNHLLLQSGYNASEEFIARQKRIMAQGQV